MHRFWILTSLCLASLGVATVENKPSNVLVVVGKNLPQYQQVATAFAEEWKKGTGKYPTVIEFAADEQRRRQLIRGHTALVVTLGDGPTFWAVGRDEDFPLAFTLVSEPERLKGFVRMLSRRQRKLLCVSIEPSEERLIELSCRIIPKLGRIGLVTHDTSLRDKVERLRGACHRKGIELEHVRVAAVADLPDRLGTLLRDVDLLWSLPDPDIFQPELAKHIITQCAQRKVPLIGLSTAFVEAGATMSFEPDYREVGQVLARISQEQPAGANLTIESTRRIVVSINQRSFRALDLPTDFEEPDVLIGRY